MKTFLLGIQVEHQQLGWMHKGVHNYVIVHRSSMVYASNIPHTSIHSLNIIQPLRMDPLSLNCLPHVGYFLDTQLPKYSIILNYRQDWKYLGWLEILC